MHRLGFRTTLRAVAGAIAGIVIWLALSPLYDRALATAATAIIRTFERPPVTRIRQTAPNVFAVDRADFDPRSPRPALALRNLTINFVLLALLFAAAPRPFADRNVLGFFLAALLLVPTHVLALVAKVMSIYALQLGPWSTMHYSSLEQNIWGGISHAYTLVLIWGFAFAAWWFFRSAETGAAAARRRKKTSRKA